MWQRFKNVLQHLFTGHEGKVIQLTIYALLHFSLDVYVVMFMARYYMSQGRQYRGELEFLDFEIRPSWNNITKLAFFFFTNLLGCIFSIQKKAVGPALFIIHQVAVLICFTIQFSAPVLAELISGHIYNDGHFSEYIIHLSCITIFLVHAWTFCCLCCSLMLFLDMLGYKVFTKKEKLESLLFFFQDVDHFKNN
ncbi:hypothetical protein B9Z55_022428 [Caenorhabditis nigoni]|uniref:Uncharacterized protein n=1 Tax=Caenorhabditis nigoni TaxID=1611254 RepID=A0A2G5SKM9_9PELO|nr:hypothetical protein B9Z55_022428 [Caenorhabditis nigoni]